MGLIAKLLAVPAVLAFFACFLYVLFGQITVRKLRKNPETKDHLGFELTGGWDILNVAAALSRPKWITNKYKKLSLSSLAASSDILYQHTTLFDRMLARAFWFSYVISGTCLILILVLNWCGVFD